MYRIKSGNPALYRQILDDQAHSWIEMRGWYLPSHIPISFRLCQAVFERRDPDIISLKIRAVYLIAVFLWIIFFLCFISVGLFSLYSKF